MRPTRLGRCALILAAAFLLAPVPVAQALVIQQVVVSSDLFPVNPDPFEDRDGAQVAGIASAEITSDIVGSISASRNDAAYGGVVYDATSAAGRYGSVGITADLSGGIYASETYTLGAQVAIYSDEFVNLSALPQQVVAKFIVDGGSIFMDAGDAVVDYQLSVIGENLGAVGSGVPGTLPTLIPAVRGPSFVSNGTFIADALGNQTFSILGDDIGASQLDRTSVEIPLSVQSLDLGVLDPGDRMAIYYLFDLDIELNGPGAFAEMVRFDVSDPLALSSTPVVTLETAPVPEPSTALLFGLGLTGLGVRERSRRSR